MTNSTHVTVDRIEENTVVLVFSNNQQVTISKEALPKDIHEGTVLHAQFLTDEEKEKKQEILAKSILNEILKTHADEKETT